MPNTLFFSNPQGQTQCSFPRWDLPAGEASNSVSVSGTNELSGLGSSPTAVPGAGSFLTDASLEISKKDVMIQTLHRIFMDNKTGKKHNKNVQAGSFNCR